MTKKFPLFVNALVLLAFAPITFLLLVGGMDIIGKKNYSLQQVSKEDELTAEKLYEKDYQVENGVVMSDKTKSSKEDTVAIIKEETKAEEQSAEIIKKEDVENEKIEKVDQDPIILGKCNQDDVPIKLKPGDTLYMYTVRDYIPGSGAGAIKLKYRTVGGDVSLKRLFRTNIPATVDSKTTVYDIDDSAEIVEKEFGSRGRGWILGDHDLSLTNRNPIGGAEIYIYYIDVEGMFDPAPPNAERHYTWGCEDYEEEHNVSTYKDVTTTTNYDTWMGAFNPSQSFTTNSTGYISSIDFVSNLVMRDYHFPEVLVLNKGKSVSPQYEISRTADFELLSETSEGKYKGYWYRAHFPGGVLLEASKMYTVRFGEDQAYQVSLGLDYNANGTKPYEYGQYSHDDYSRRKWYDNKSVLMKVNMDFLPSAKLSYDRSEKSSGFFKGYNLGEVRVNTDDTYVFSAYILPGSIEAGSEIKLCTQYWTRSGRHINGEIECSGQIDLTGVTEWTRFEVRDDDIPANAYYPRSFIAFSGAPSEIYIDSASYVNESDDSLNLWGQWGSFENASSLENAGSNGHGWFTWSAYGDGSGYNNSDSLVAEIWHESKLDVTFTKRARWTDVTTDVYGQSFKPTVTGKLDYIEFCTRKDYLPRIFSIREGENVIGDDNLISSTGSVSNTGRSCAYGNGTWFKVDFSQENTRLTAQETYTLVFDDNSATRLLYLTYNDLNPYKEGRMYLRGKWHDKKDLLGTTYMIKIIPGG